MSDLLLSFSTADASVTLYKCRLMSNEIAEFAVFEGENISRRPLAKRHILCEYTRYRTTNLTISQVIIQHLFCSVTNKK